MDHDIPYSFVQKYGLFPQQDGAGATRILMRASQEKMPATELFWALGEIQRVLGQPCAVEKTALPIFKGHVMRHYADMGASTSPLAPEEAGDSSALVDLLECDSDAPVIRFINQTIAQAVRMRASDIHFEPFAERLVIRFRIDGIMREMRSLPAGTALRLLSRVKVMARLDIAERRRPQDGRASLQLDDQAIDVRIATLPCRFGERLTMRLLPNAQDGIGIGSLGMTAHQQKTYHGALRKPHGLILVTGPTGSGKTTTLYAGLHLLASETRNILSIEDPIEYAIKGANQTQIDPKTGLTFAVGLRALLRHDPDIVMVGEIRDSETAHIALRAAMTGHLVLSTIHTNAAIAAITRLRDMGVEPFLLASTLRLLIAQRLVRRLCPVCRVRVPLSDEARRYWAAEQGDHLFAPGAGCQHCAQSGYRGRVGVFDVVAFDDALRSKVHACASEEALRRAAGESQMQAHARELLLAGETSQAEIFTHIDSDV